MSKIIASQIVEIVEKQQYGRITYDRALEDISEVIKNYAEDRPIVGFVKVGTLKKVLTQIVSTKKRNEERSYIFNVEIHQNEMFDIERMITALYTKNELESRKDLTYNEYKIYIKGILLGGGKLKMEEVHSLMSEQEYFIEQCYTNKRTIEHVVKYLKEI